MPTEILIEVFMSSMKKILSRSISACNKDMETDALLARHFSNSPPFSFFTDSNFRVEIKMVILLCGVPNCSHLQIGLGA